MNQLPPALVHHGALAVAEPTEIRGRGLDASSDVALTEDGRLLLRSPGGLLASPKIVPLDRADADLEVRGRRFVVVGPVRVELDLDPDSRFAAGLRAWSRGEVPDWTPGEGWTRLGLATCVVQHLAADPNAPPVGVAVGTGRSSTTVFAHDDGRLLLDDPHAVVEVDRVRALVPTGSTVDVQAIAPADGGWRVGVRLTFAKPVGWPSRGTPVEAVVAAKGRGMAGDRPFAGVVFVRTADHVEALDDHGDPRAALPVRGLAWTHARRLLLRGPDASAVVRTSAAGARRLVGDLDEDRDLVEIVGQLVPAGAGRARVDGDTLVVETAAQASVPLGDLPVDGITVERDRTLLRLRVDDRLTVRGHAETIVALHAAAGAHAGRSALLAAPLPELYRTWHTLRTQRWLWLALGPVFHTDHLLEQAARMKEPGDDADTARRRQLVAETLIVARQVRAVRLRLGAVPVALPYALLDEEAAWLDALLAGQGAPALEPWRRRVVDGFRGALRGAGSHLAFALQDLDRAVARLEPVHHPELRGEQSVWGRLGLGAAMLLLNPISGTIQIASAVVGKVTEHVSRDGRSAALIDHFGPQCRTGWTLLVQVAALAALELRQHLTPLWADLARRDRALWEALDDDGRAAMRIAIVDAIIALRRFRLAAVDDAGHTVGHLIDRMDTDLEAGARDLLAEVTGHA